LKAAAPKGIDIYFENVGGKTDYSVLFHELNTTNLLGKTLDIVLKQLNNYSRIPLCGLISGYNAQNPVPGPYNFHMLLMRRVKLQGFIVLDYAARFGEALQQIEEWVVEGKLKYRSDIVDGLENAPKVTNYRLCQ